jgi:hypothetical protein
MQRSWRHTLVCTGLVLAAVSCSEKTDSAASGPQAPLVVEPNLGVGKIRAGMTTQQVIAEMGQPQRRTGNALEYTRLGLAVLPDTNGVVKVVMCGDVTGLGGPLVKAFTGRTPEGIGMNSTRDEVVKALGEPSSSERFRGGTESLGYEALGLTLTLEAGKVHHLIVRLKNPQQPDRNVNLVPAPDASK